MPNFNVLLMSGIPTTMIQNQVYALPAKRCLVFSNAAIEASLSDASGFTALTGANVAPGVETAMPFVRSTTADNTISAKIA